MEEKELIENCLSGDSKSQKILYEQFSKKMYGVCLRFTKSNAEADDILQEGFIKIFSNLKYFKHTGSLEGWIRKTIINTSINHIKQNNEYKVTINKAENIATVSVDEMATTDILNLIQALPTGYRTIFNLYAVEGFNHKEIAKLLNISENTSKSQLSRARLILKQKLK